MVEDERDRDTETESEPETDTDESDESQEQTQEVDPVDDEVEPVAVPRSIDDVPRIELSRTARRQIAKHLPDQLDEEYILEVRKPVALLFFPLNDDEGEEPNDVIVKETLAMLASFVFMIAGFWFLPSDFGVARLLVAIPLVITGLWWYEGFRRWFDWRFVLSTKHASILDKPSSFPGGEVPSVKLEEVKYANSATARSRRLARKPRSVLAGALGLQWGIMDTIVSADKSFNWFGPMKRPTYIISIVRLAIERAKQIEMLEKEALKGDFKSWLQENGGTAEDYFRQRRAQY